MKITDAELVSELQSGKTIREIATVHGMDPRGLWRRKKSLDAKGFGHGGDVFKMYRHGDTVLFFHHGHRVRFEQIESVMISKFRRVFGETSYTYCHVGHLHHQKIVESRNMIVEHHAARGRLKMNTHRQVAGCQVAVRT